ncbi:MAG TPA: histidine decarboxylase [Candidatus Saccharimonadales bacterium]|nr:histidine decarboxylase [Candidatus Saccharimonadales bacterium]
MYQADNDTAIRIKEFMERIRTDYKLFIGFPGSTDFDYRELYPFFGYLLNNVGDPYQVPLHANHSKAMEQEVVEFFADLFRAPKKDRWGYVNNGGTEGNLYALYVARELYPKARVYYSQTAHYSLPKNVHILGMPSTVIKVRPNDEIDYDDLQHELDAHKSEPAIVVANIGTTMAEARDDVAKIKRILNDTGIGQHFVHSDAALAGTYTALLRPHHPFDFKDGADSVSISGHKFIGSPMACGVVIVRKSHMDTIRRSASYVGSPDTTISGSRNGHTPLLLWYAIQRWGLEGFRKRAEASLALAEYTHSELQRIGWQTWRNPSAITVMLASPPRKLIYKWQLATHDGTHFALSSSHSLS